MNVLDPDGNRLEMRHIPGGPHQIPIVFARRAGFGKPVAQRGPGWRGPFTQESRARTDPARGASGVSQCSGVPFLAYGITALFSTEGLTENR